MVFAKRPQPQVLILNSNKAVNKESASLLVLIMMMIRMMTVMIIKMIITMIVMIITMIIPLTCAYALANYHACHLYIHNLVSYLPDFKSRLFIGKSIYKPP